MHPWIEIFGEKIPTYLLWISLTYCFALIYLYKRGKNKGYSKNIILDSALIVMLAGFVGARLFHVFYEEASYYLEDPLRIFYIWQGGFVYFGGALTAYLSLRIWARNKPIDFDQLLDIYAPVIVLVDLLASLLVAAMELPVICPGQLFIPLELRLQQEFHSTLRPFTQAYGPSPTMLYSCF